ncbi:MAG: hypothetical protein JW786_07865 [Desulfobacterales bacterium]|nr:hypothetical protein [Desulfobacterales bacterium]
MLCDPTGEFCGLSPSDVTCVNSPVRCLDKAVTDTPKIIVIRFGKMPLREREPLLELCAVLKQNRYTSSCTVLALLNSKHRTILERLREAGVDFVKFASESLLDFRQIQFCIHRMGQDDRVERQLAMLCPFLHYSKVDSQHEMKVCGAYLDRMVLGGCRLNEICETDNHLHCEYYLKPRP